MAGIFGEFFLVSVSHETKYENSSKIRGKFGAKFGAKFGTKIRKFGELSFCNFSDLMLWNFVPGQRDRKSGCEVAPIRRLEKAVAVSWIL